MASLADVVKVAQGVESFKAGDAVWVEDEEQAWAPAVVSYVNRGSIEVIHSKESETPGERVTCDVSGDTTSKIISKKQNMRLLARSKATRLPKRSGAMGRAGTKDKEEEGYENMDDMTHLHEASILNNLELRYWQNSIYTATGPILIAINPYQRLPIYGKDMMKKYVGATAGSIVSVSQGLRESGWKEEGVQWEKKRERKSPRGRGTGTVEDKETQADRERGRERE